MFLLELIPFLNWITYLNAFYTELPAIKYENVVEPAFEMGTVTFPFRHAVMETGLLVDVSNATR